MQNGGSNSGAFVAGARAVDDASKATHSTSEGSSERSSRKHSQDGFDNDDGGGVFVNVGLGGSSSCSSSSASRASKEEAGDEATGEAKKKKKQRKILFKGKWYTEDEIAAMERVAKSLSDKIKTMKQRSDEPENAGSVTDKGGQNEGPNVSGFKTKGTVDQSPEALAAAIFVVQGGHLTKISKRKLAGEKRSLPVKMSTGGMITWGSKSAHVMRASVQKERYDPKMSKTSYRDMGCKFTVVLEGDKFFAHSNDGGTVRAVEGRALEFTADSSELCVRYQVLWLHLTFARLHSCVRFESSFSHRLCLWCILCVLSGGSLALQQC